MVESSQTGYHQIDADLSLPCSSDLFERVITRDQVLAIIDSIGFDNLHTLAQKDNYVCGSLDGVPANDPRWQAVFKDEAATLGIVRAAISKALPGVQKPWIMGSTSDFAKGLLECVSQ